MLDHDLLVGVGDLSLVPGLELGDALRVREPCEDVLRGCGAVYEALKD